MSETTAAQADEMDRPDSKKRHDFYVADFSDGGARGEKEGLGKSENAEGLAIIRKSGYF